MGTSLGIPSNGFSVLSPTCSSFVRQAAPLLQKVDPTHPLQTNRWAAPRAFRVVVKPDKSVFP